MRLLLDTHLLVWGATRRPKVPARAVKLIEDPANELLFSVVSLWELAVKTALRRSNIRIDVRRLRDGLLANGYLEILVEARHVFALQTLPPVHGDPFDRLLLAQSIADQLSLLTSDQNLADYDGPVIKV